MGATGREEKEEEEEEEDLSLEFSVRCAIQNLYHFRFAHARSSAACWSSHANNTN
jgi:hypothetical protein